MTGKDSDQLRPRQAEELRRLLRVLDNSSGFQLLIIESSDPRYRDRLIDLIDHRTTKASTTLAVYDFMAQDVPALEARLHSLATSFPIIHLVGLNDWWLGPDGKTRLQTLNYRREAIVQSCPVSLVWWLSRSAIKELALTAPDLWAWRSAVLSFETGTIRWLQLSDLHLGVRAGASWWRIHKEFEQSIREYAAELGMPDLILITGDLSFRGAVTEFEQVDAFLETLIDWLMEATGSDRRPLIFPVPGNHDLQRPEGRALRDLRFLQDYASGSSDPDIAEFQRDLWGQEDAGDIAPLFVNYQAWLEASILPQFQGPEFDRHQSHFPGDLSVLWRPEGKFPLLLVGLNSAWMQFQAGDFHGRLELSPQQFRLALGKDGLQRWKHADQALLLMHHPVDWLSPKAHRDFLESIYTPGRFALCLHGHRHRGHLASVSNSGGAYRYWFQSSSLFGLEYYGNTNERRAVGYAWGDLTLDGQVRVWPLRRSISGGEGVFAPDFEFGDFPIVIRKPPMGQPSKSRSHSPVGITPWLEDTLSQTGHIDIRGIGSGAGRVRSTSRFPIERLYTPLRCRVQGGAGEGALRLETLLPHHRLLLIEGQAGAGKTSFLRFTAALLARDCLGLSAPGGGAWRERYLGMNPNEPALIPVFLRLALMEPLLGQSSLQHPDTRERLLDLMLPEGTVEQRGGWQRMFESGEVILLLDGMDEVGDEVKRGRMLTILGDLVTYWTNIRVVVTSCPIDTRPLVEVGFTRVAIEPFDRSQVVGFIDHWVAALYDTGPGEQLYGEARDYQQPLLAAITQAPQLRRLAANPLMLTCLCVVHRNKGGFPDTLARLYRVVLHWLRTARSAQRAELDISDSFAERAFSALALAMMDGYGSSDGRMRVLFDLEEAVEALMPIIEHDYPEESTLERLMWLRDWLRFECTGSGIIEELGRNRLRFSHRSFQEYLAAQQLACLGDGEGNDDWWPRIRLRLDDPQWRETVKFLPGCLLDEGGARRVDRLLERVLGLLDEDAELPEQARVAGIMGRLLEPMGAYGYRPATSADLCFHRLLEHIMRIFEWEGAGQVPIQDRIAAAEALGRGGDPRLTRGLDKLIEVPGLGGWSLGKYPITVEEYMAFIDDGGYYYSRWWDPSGWQQRENKVWQAPGDWEQQLLTPNRPVVNVSWFEACAYCAWLSTLRGREVSLPSEAQWLRTAQGTDGRHYPWGDDKPDPERANFDRNVGGPTPVGIYPAGNGPFGHCDLGGNVWEWCSDLCSEDDPADDVNGDPKAARALRGGGWPNPATRLWVASRLRRAAGDRVPVAGFRIAVGPADP